MPREHQLLDAVERVHARVLAELDVEPDVERVVALVGEEAPLLPEGMAGAVADRVLARLRGLGALEPFLHDERVSDVLVNGDGRVWVERAGILADTGCRLRAAEVGQLIQRVLAPLGLRADLASPFADGRLTDGSRVHAVVPPLAVDGPCMAIRRFGARPASIGDFAAPPVVELLTGAVRARTNMVVAGGAGAGKTTLLNALAAAVAPDERVITIEDAAELRLPLDHVVRLEARPPNAEGAGAVSVRTLVRNALRMRPDRIVVGEVRGGEALDMLQAMNTGHDGSLTTCHANGCDDALRRLETMVLLSGVALPLAAIRAQLAAAVDLVLHVARCADGSRRVVEVRELGVATDGGVATRRLATGDAVVAMPTRPRLRDRPQ